MDAVAMTGLDVLVWLLGGLGLGAGMALYLSATARVGETEAIQRGRRTRILFATILICLAMTASFVLPVIRPMDLAGLHAVAGTLEATEANARTLQLILANLLGPGLILGWLYFHMRASPTEFIRRRRALAFTVVGFSDMFAMMALIDKIWS